jgi:hypothetical protein
MQALRCLFILIAALVLNLPLRAAENAANQRVIRILTEVRVPEMRFKNAEMEEVLAFVVQASREADPDGIGLNLFYMAPKPGQPQPPRVTLDVRNLSLGETLRLVSEMTGMVLVLERGIVRVEPPGSQKMETRFYSVDPAQFNLFVERAQQR